MTRFKELARIEAAIENGDLDELRWAAAYCTMRLSILSRKEHIAYWESVRRKVASAIKTEE
jgi:hypothetical protein